MNTVLLRRTWRALTIRVLLISIALAIWGFLMPVIYSQFGVQFKHLFESGAFPKQLADFGGGDIFSLPGAIALGFVHPISVALVSVFAVGFASSAIAGERQRGTLEVLLSRPLARREVYLTMLAACFTFIGVVIAAQIVGAYVGSLAFGVAADISPANLVLLWFNGLLLYGAFASIGLAASVSFDRLGPAIGITLAVVVVSYFLQILGSLWPDAEPLQPYSLFHYLAARDILAGGAHATDLVVLAAVVVLGVAWSLYEFPRRDLAAPS